jgi:hypothetical protein
MSYVRAVCCVLLASALAGPVSAQDVEPIRITLHPAAPAGPALRHRLLPALHEMAPGNAADLYKQAIAEMKKDRPAAAGGADLGDVDDLLDLPPAELPRDKARKLLDRYREVFRLADRAARSESCDWGITERIRKMGVNVVLAEVHDMRALARLLALRARLDVLEGRTDRAVRDLQTGFAAARHVGDNPTLICSLVGLALTAITTKELDLLLAQEKAPGLYWALADLPRPFIDLRKAMEGERLFLYGTFPGLLEAVNNPDAPPLRPEQIKPGVKLLAEELSVGKDYPTRAAVSLLIRAKHNAAKEALAAAGYPRTQVDKMPRMEVALLHATLQYDRLFDEALKWQTFPYPEARKGMEQAEREARQARAKVLSPAGDVPALPLATLFLPAVQKVFAARARIDRRFAALRCVEAVRLYAAAHGGKLPPTLSAITEVPVPSDPYLGKPFAYRVRSGVATLEGPPPPGEKANAGNSLVYELTLEK